MAVDVRKQRLDDVEVFPDVREPDLQAAGGAREDLAVVALGAGMVLAVQVGVAPSAVERTEVAFESRVGVDDAAAIVADVGTVRQGIQGREQGADSPATHPFEVAPR